LHPRYHSRSDARPGDLLFVTGPLGGSLSSGRHLRFDPRFDAMRWLIDNVALHAVMDISDGIATDLPRMMTASGTGAVILEDCIPIHPDVSASLSPAARLQAALCDGEDFELLFSVPQESTERLLAAPSLLRCTQIGRVTDNGTILIEDISGRTRPLQPGGWQHGI
jgi:thiamine-monophosphate kinase